MATATEEIIVAPWGIEVGPNSDWAIATINQKMRGSTDAAHPITKADGKKAVPVDRMAGMGDCPPVPAERLFVNPAECTWLISDPLADDSDLCEEITQWMKNKGKRIGGDKIKGRERRTGRVDEDTMKTLCREMVNMVEAGEATVVRGTKPHRSEVDDLPGDYLFNAGALTRWNGPRHEKDADAYREKVESFGG